MEKQKIVGFIKESYEDEIEFEDIRQQMVKLAQHDGFDIDVFEFDIHDVIVKMESGNYKEVIFDTLGYNFRYLIDDLRDILISSQMNEIPFYFLNHDFDTRFNPTLVDLMNLIYGEL